MALMSSDGATRNTPTRAVAVGRRRAARALAGLGEQIAAARGRRGWTQLALATRLGITQARQSQIEAGKSGGLHAELWFATAEALGVPLRFEFARDPFQELEDAGHLELQEVMLAFGRQTGFSRTFELPVGTTSGVLSVDVGLRDDARRLLVLEECWNTFANLGASVRNTRRKVGQLEQFAVAAGGERGAYRVAACWVIRDLPRNRALAARYPEIFDATFTASSHDWVSALTKGADPPRNLGVVWCDPRQKRLSAFVTR